jgi:hypothetical protein
MVEGVDDQDEMDGCGDLMLGAVVVRATATPDLVDKLKNRPSADVNNVCARFPQAGSPRCPPRRKHGLDDVVAADRAGG